MEVEAGKVSVETEKKVKRRKNRYLMKYKYAMKIKKRGGEEVGKREIVKEKGLKELILRLAGEFKKPQEIMVEVAREYPGYYERSGWMIKGEINGIINKNKGYVNALRDKYAKGVMEVPGAHKRVRLERLEGIWDKDEGLDGKRDTLRSMREEMEGARVNLNLYEMNIFGGISDEELREREEAIIKRICDIAGGKKKEEESPGILILPAAREAEVIPFK